MRLEFHRQVASDISRITDHYEGIAGSKLADEFFFELQTFFQKAADHPEAYDIRAQDLRRVNLERFPYHFLSRSFSDDADRALDFSGDDERLECALGRR